MLVAIGEEPDPSILPPGTGIEVSAWAGIVADPRTMATGRAGVFAGGDVVSGPKTIIDAVASGRRAAAAIHEFLAGVPDGNADILRVVRYQTPPEPRLQLDLAERARARTPLPVLDRDTLRTSHPGFTEVQARSEASRCFRCDAVYSCATVEVVAGRGPADAPTHRSAPPVGADRRHRHRPGSRRSAMTPEQVTGFFDAGESFVEGTIAAALVALWLLVLALHVARPYMVANLHKFTLRLGADLWWIIYVGLRDVLLVQVFLGSFIFFYPDVVAGQDLPVTGGSPPCARWRCS